MPAKVAREAHLHSDQRVRISIMDKQIIITPIVSEQLTLKERLANFNPDVRGCEVMTVCKYVKLLALLGTTYSIGSTRLVCEKPGNLVRNLVLALLKQKHARWAGV